MEDNFVNGLYDSNDVTRHLAAMVIEDLERELKLIREDNIGARICLLNCLNAFEDPLSISDIGDVSNVHTLAKKVESEFKTLLEEVQSE